MALTSDPTTGALRLDGDTARAGALDVWVPAGALPPPVVDGTNISGVRVTTVDGGYRVTARATGTYELTLTR